MHRLTEENELLRTRLRDVVQSPLSDTEKHQIIQDSQRLHNSAPASIAIPTVSYYYSTYLSLYTSIIVNFPYLIRQNQDTIDGTPCVTPDWDKNSSCSEVSVANLQDKISQVSFVIYSGGS